MMMPKLSGGSVHRQLTNSSQCHDLMELIEDRHGRRSMLVTSQLAIKHCMTTSWNRRSLTRFWIACCGARPWVRRGFYAQNNSRWWA